MHLSNVKVTTLSCAENSPFNVRSKVRVLLAVLSVLTLLFSLFVESASLADHCYSDNLAEMIITIWEDLIQLLYTCALFTAVWCVARSIYMR
jgi:hypothetical protein